MTTGREIAIGDIHGCVHALEAVLEALEPQPDDCLVVLGDVIDMGRESAACIDVLMNLAHQCQLVAILGNHEEMLLNALENPRCVDPWLMMGGQATLNSYRFNATLRSIPAEHIEFLKSFRPYYETATHLYLHAGFEPELPLAETPEHVLRWSIFQPEDRICHQSGKTAILGHTELHNGEILDLGCVKLIDTYCHGYGWLTALDVHHGTLWQASRWGQLREDQAARDLRRAEELLHPATE